MNNKEYVRLSLEIHLFFDRIMMEHSLFLRASFMEKDDSFKKAADEYHKLFSNILKGAIELADGNISSDFLTSSEIATKNTIEAEIQTSNLTGVKINTDITQKELSLKSGNIDVSNEMLNKISYLNNRTLTLVDMFIKFKNDVLTNVLNCKMYTANYPLLIKHIMNEAKMYLLLLNKIENRIALNEKDIYEQELFWNNIMKEHAEFIRGLLDPTEEELIATADKYANEYKIIMNDYNRNIAYLTTSILNETMNFRNFKIAGEEGILNCKVRSIIIPLLADHVVREANHFIRILQSIKS